MSQVPPKKRIVPTLINGKRIGCEGCEINALNQYAHSGEKGCMDWKIQAASKYFKAQKSVETACLEIESIYAKQGVSVRHPLIKKRFDAIRERMVKEFPVGLYGFKPTNHCFCIEEGLCEPCMLQAIQFFSSDFCFGVAV